VKQKHMVTSQEHRGGEACNNLNFETHRISCPAFTKY